MWLRAQKSWQSQGLSAAGRPQIKKSHVVTAEPMPGDAALLDEFITRCLSRTPEEKLLGQLLRRVVEAMKLAGEAGALLKIEEEIAADIAGAKAKWHAQPKVKQTSFLEEPPHPEQADLGLDVSGITDEAFWEQAEAQIYAALQQYAEQAEADSAPHRGEAGGGRLRRRLFAGDAARGFAFIDLCRRKYDVVLMNPPFGEPTTISIDYIKAKYPLAFIDILATFVDRCHSLIKNGKVGALTSRACLYTKTLSEWRVASFIQNIDALADLGGGVLDGAVVFASASVFTIPQSNSSTFLAIDLRRDAVRDQCLLKKLTKFRDGDVDPDIFYRKRKSFLHTNNARLLYNIPDSFWDWTQSAKTLESAGGSARAGSTTYDDFRFLRLAWEVASQKIGWAEIWVFLSKGGNFESFYNDIHLMINWLDNGSEVGEFNRIKYATDAQSKRASTYYKLPGVTYTRRTAKGFSPRVFPRDCIFADKGPVIFSPVNDEYEPGFSLGYLSSLPIRAFIHLQVQAGSFETGVINTVPWLDDPKIRRDIQDLTILAWTKKAKVYSFSEVDRLFMVPDLSRYSLLKDWYQSLRGEFAEFSKDVVEICDSISRVVTSYFSLPQLDYEPFDVSPTDHEIQDYLEISNETTSAILVLQLMVGFVYGRWDIRYATGQKQPPKLPDPFDPLPACPPGMLQNSQGLSAAPADMPPDYPLRISWPGILVDDPGHPEDIEARVREALRVIWPDKADAIEQEACQILGVASLRDYFANPNNFFDDHLKRYSKSRRAAPIYWPLSTPSGSYTLWLYYHRLDHQILYTGVNDFVDPKLKEVSRQAGALRQKTGRSQSDETELTRLTDLEAELRDFRAELLRLAAFWRPNLNDGVQITAAPLWRLFQHRPWQARLKETWDKLDAGEYDWAHLAMALWPERVVPKCVQDRSLAIAHEVEDLFWVEDEGTWRLVRPVAQELAEQIERRQNAAHQRLGEHLAGLAANAGRGLPAYQVWQHLSEGDWDDTRLALALWPERVAEKCWDQPFLAAQLGLKLPAKRTQAHRDRWVKKLLAEGVPELTAAVAAAFQDDSAAFDAVWQALAAGQRDEQPLALALWPARVVDKCVGNVELALQHGLARYFWVQPPGSDSWRRRNPQAQEVRDEVTRRKGR